MSFLNRIAQVSAGLGVGSFLVNQIIYDVDGGERVVMFNRFKGVEVDTVGEGTHFKIPWVQTPFHYSIRTHPTAIQSETGTKDLQMVKLTLRVLSRPSVEKLPEIHQRLGMDYNERVLPSIGNEVLKAVVAQYNADQLLTMREKVSQDIRQQLTKRSTDFHIELDDVSITHLSFGQEFSQAIEKKQVAQQEAERSKFVVMRSEQEKKAAVVRAEGESESATLISEATKQSTALVELRKLEAAKDIAATLARSRNVIYLPQTANMLLQVPQ